MYDQKNNPQANNNVIQSSPNKFNSGRPIERVEFPI